MIVGRTSSMFDGELFQPFGIIDLVAEPDREMLPAGMLIGVGEGEEGQEHLVLPAEILG
jgi:hypothetical protein